MVCAFVTSMDDDESTRDVLRSLGHSFSEGNTVVVEVEDRPGGLAEVTERLTAAGVRVDGIQVLARRPGAVELAISVDDEARARETLGLPGSAPDST